MVLDTKSVTVGLELGGGGATNGGRGGGSDGSWVLAMEEGRAG